jgi:GlpG protein
MRNIGTLPTDQEATRFSGALYLRGIENDVEAEDDGTFSIWVHDDAQLAEARSFLDRFRTNPKAEDFSKAPAAASRARAEAERAERARGSNVITRERMDYERNFQEFAWLPTLMIVACVAVAAQADTIFHSTPANLDWLKWLYTSNYPAAEQMPEVRSGEVWRLFTPMFIHYGAMHLLFNMMWLRDLGTFTQNRFGTLYLIVLVLVIAGVSDYGQFLITNDYAVPHGGGMSGVNYGLFGFLWMRSRFDRFATWKLNPLIIQTMLFWFLLCFTPLIPNVANGAHFAGLALGMAWGVVSGKFSKSR